tara:strand:+ start:2852 stop:3574 length:723 start_codon:yes stop_codon:yes gene_type:complete
MCDFVLEPTAEQQAALDAPLSVANLDGLLAADFLGKQDYIRRWILAWLESNDVDPETLPLCIGESIQCFPKTARKYTCRLKEAIFFNDLDYLQRHYLWLDGVWHWTYADFRNMRSDVFDFLWSKAKVPAELLGFVCAGRDPYTWLSVVEEYGPTPCLAIAIGQKWVDGVRTCLDYGADIHAQDFVPMALKNADIFRMVTDCNPPATDQAWQSFQVRKKFGGIPDVPLVEQWFYTHGYKDS